MSQDAAIEFPVVGIVPLSLGGANADLSATGPGFLKQDTAGATIRVASAYEVFQAGKNGIINGNFDIWQATTSVAASTGTYSADCWQAYVGTGTAAGTISRAADQPTLTTSVPYSNYCWKLTVTATQASYAAGNLAAVYTMIEGYDWQRFWQRQTTVSFWVKSSVTGTYCVTLRSGGLDRSYVATYTINSANTWEYKTATFSASPSSGTWNMTTGIGAYLLFCFGSGSTFQTTAGAWQTGNYFSTSAQANLFAVNGSTWQVAQVQLEVGAYASPFEMRQYTTELALCKRYYEILGGFATNEMMGVGMNNSTTASQITIRYEVAKRIVPTITAAAASNFTVASSTGTPITCTVITFNVIGTVTANMPITVASGLVAGNANYFYSLSTAGIITVDARF